MKDTSDIEEKFWEEEPPDPEFASLPSKRRRRARNPWIMMAVILIGFFMIYWLRVDLVYFFRSETPLELGEVTEVNFESVESNTYIHLNGIPNPIKVVRFSKRLNKGFFRLFPLVGTTNVFVQIHVKEEGIEEKKEKKKTSELPGEFTGRAIRFEELEKTGITSSSYKNIRDFFFEKFYFSIPGSAILVMDGDNPRSYWLYPLLAALISFFIIFNSILFVSYVVRRAKRKDSERGKD